MVPIKLERDEARAIQQYFFPYLVEVCRLKKRDAADQDETLTQIIIIDTFDQVCKLFEKKLSNISNVLHFKFTDAQAIVLYKLLMNMPIENQNVWLVNLRQLICNIFYNEILELIPP
jgi:hypothetical protein